MEIEDIMNRVTSSLTELYKRPCIYTLFEGKVEIFIHGYNLSCSAGNQMPVELFEQYTVCFGTEEELVQYLVDGYKDFIKGKLMTDKKEIKLQTLKDKLEHLYQQKMNVKLWKDGKKHMVAFMPYSVDRILTIPLSRLERKMKEDEMELLSILGNLSNGDYRNKNFKVLNTIQMAPQQYRQLVFNESA